MEKDLKKFNENLEIKKDVSVYEDEKGNLLYIPTLQLVCSCEYTELEEAKIKIAKFNGEIKNESEFNKIKTTKKVDKFTETKKEKDRGTIIDKEVEAYQVWFVRNGLKLAQSYNNKEEALAYAKEINNKILEIQF